jgi:competence ComEA-like helix-hairpin-helix protein
VHTRAAQAQRLFKHSLAYVKQNLLLAKSRPPFIALAVFAILFASACVTIPRPPQSVTQSNLDTPKAAFGLKININTASTEALEALPGIGRGIAEGIVAHREQYGPFRRAEHLMMVRGISDRKFRQLRSMIVVA